MVCFYYGYFFHQPPSNFCCNSTNQSHPGLMPVQGRRAGSEELCSVSRRVPFSREMGWLQQPPGVGSGHGIATDASRQPARVASPGDRAWPIFSVPPELLCARAAALLPRTGELWFAEQQKGSRNPGQGGEVLRDHTALSSAQNLSWDSPPDFTLVSVSLMNTNSCGWLLSLNPYFRISGFTEPEKFGEFPLKFNVYAQ